MFFTEIMEWARATQHLFNDLILSNLQALQQAPEFVSYAGLSLIGFLYGILHAAGPGHGKAVVSSYIMATENSLKRGIIVATLGALLQAVTAIVLVCGYFYLMQASRTEAQDLEKFLGLVSFVLISFVGTFLIVRGIADLRKFFRAPSHSGHGHDHEHGHHHHEHHGHCCGHNHAPSPQQVMKAPNNKVLALMALSIGIRPCTGALLLLFFACKMGLVGAGILATLAMGVGTAITTGGLALLAVKARHLSLHFLKKSDKKLYTFHAGLRIAGGIGIILLAVCFYMLETSGENTTSSFAHPLYKSLH